MSEQPKPPGYCHWDKDKDGTYFAYILVIEECNERHRLFTAKSRAEVEAFALGWITFAEYQKKWNDYTFRMELKRRQGGGR